MSLLPSTARIRILDVKVGHSMYTIIQQGEQDNWFYTLQVDGRDFEHFTSLTAASEALERCKEAVEARQPSQGMVRWFKEDSDE